MYAILIELEGNPYPMELCRVEQASSVGNVISTLLAVGVKGPLTIKRVEPDPPPDPPGFDAFKGGGT